MGQVVPFPKVRAASSGGLTRRQRKALAFIRTHAAAHNGAWPSMEAIGRELRIRSLSGTRLIVRSLMDLGAI